MDRYPEAIALVLDGKFTKQTTMAVLGGLQVGYNEAAAYVTRMEREGIISAPNAVGVRTILKPDAAA